MNKIDENCASRFASSKIADPTASASAQGRSRAHPHQDRKTSKLAAHANQDLQNNKCGTSAGHCVCVKCAAAVPDLFTCVGKDIRLRHCDSCGRVVDHYIEYDLLLVCIDLQLYREAVYLHILFNRFAGTKNRLKREAWRFLLVCVLLDSHENYVQSRSGRLHFALFGAGERFQLQDLGQQVWQPVALAFAELGTYLLVTSFVTRFLASRVGGSRRTSSHLDIVIAISVSSYCKLYMLLAMLWARGHHYDQVQVCVVALVLAANVMGIKASLLDQTWTVAITAVVIGAVARWLVAVCVERVLAPT